MRWRSSRSGAGSSRAGIERRADGRAWSSDLTAAWTNTRLRIAEGDNRPLWEGKGEGINPNALPPAPCGRAARGALRRGVQGHQPNGGGFFRRLHGGGGRRPRPRARRVHGAGADQARLQLPPDWLSSDPDIALVGALERVAAIF
jgi:hypothetical protein